MEIHSKQQLFGFFFQVEINTLPTTNSTLASSPLKQAEALKGKGSSPNHYFSGGKQLVSGNVSTWVLLMSDGFSGISLYQKVGF